MQDTINQIAAIILFFSSSVNVDAPCCNALMNTGKDEFEKSPADRTLSRSSSSSLATCLRYHAENVILGSDSSSTGLCTIVSNQSKREEIVIMATSGSLVFDSSSLRSSLVSTSTVLFDFFSFLTFLLISTSLSESLLELVSDDEETVGVSKSSFQGI
jgi:hypothetical protein